MKDKVTIRKWNGDDRYSWAVFVNNALVHDLTGLNISQARYYRDQIKAELAAKTTQTTETTVL